jgi:hypothetical protein
MKQNMGFPAGGGNATMVNAAKRTRRANANDSPAVLIGDQALKLAPTHEP